MFEEAPIALGNRLEGAIAILHIDDNEASRYVISRMLRQAGFNISEATTGEQGLQMAAKHKPDLIILDVQLPDLSGFEVCRQIKANPVTAIIPVLHLSASFVESSDKAQGLDSGADAYLVQPVEAIELIATIKSLLRIRQAEESALTLAREWQTTFDSIKDGVGLLDKEGRFLRCNSAMTQLLRKPFDEIIGGLYQEIMPTLLGSIDVTPFRSIQETRCRESLEIQSNGQWFSITFDPVFAPSGAFTGTVYIVADITGRRQAEEALRFLAQASRVLAASLDYETTLANIARLAVPTLADFCIFDIVTADKQIQRVAWQHADPTNQELFEQAQRYVPSDSCQNHPVASVLFTGKANFVPEVSDAWMQAVAMSEDHLQFMRDLEIRSWMSVPLIARDQTLGALTLGLVARSRLHYTSSDLSLAQELAQRAALALDNARAHRNAQEANRIKDEFLAVLSHELRSPLNPILGWTSLLRGRQYDQKTTARALETIERNAKLQTQLIEDLLDVSRILQGKINLNVCPVDLVSTIEAAIETVGLAVQVKSIEIQTVFEPNVGLVLGDPNRLQQVVWNLLSNAVKFTPSKGRVEIRLEAVDSHAQISVSDSGKGINSEFLPHVFDYFRQENSTTTRVFGGLGLGLAIVRYLVELHGGTVGATSLGEGQGATFTVMLPLMNAVPNKSEHEGLPDNSTNLDGIKILLVEDDVDTRELLVFILEEYGASVTAVESASEALLALAQSKPDVLLSDIGMPETDGYMLIRHIRAMSPLQGGEIKAIALTAYAGETDHQQILKAGFQKHITKPVDPLELAAAIANLVAYK